jgi:hypothetical protein
VVTVANALQIVGSAIPLAAMLAALFAAVWIAEGRREGEAVRSSSGRQRRR